LKVSIGRAIEYGITMDCYTNMNLFLEDQRDHIIYVFVVLHAGNATAICVGNYWRRIRRQQPQSGYLVDSSELLPIAIS
jgi:hypothetical protein